MTSETPGMDGGRLQGLVDDIMDHSSRHKEWMDNPTTNFLTSIGIQRAMVVAQRPTSDSWTEEVGKLNALMEALRRVVVVTGKVTTHDWTLAQLKLEATGTYRSAAWTTAVVLADALGLLTDDGHVR